MRVLITRWLTRADDWAHRGVPAHLPLGGVKKRACDLYDWWLMHG